MLQASGRHRKRRRKLNCVLRNADSDLIVARVFVAIGGAGANKERDIVR